MENEERESILNELQQKLNTASYNYSHGSSISIQNAANLEMMQIMEEIKLLRTCESKPNDEESGSLNIARVTTRTFTKGQKVRVLVGCVWQKAEVEDYHEDPKYYLCGTNDWSTHFHESMIKAD